MQKSVTRKYKFYPVFNLFDPDFIDSADRGFLTLFGRSKCLEIMFPQQKFRCFPHGIQIQVFRFFQCIAPPEYIGNLTVDDAVAVSFPCGIQPAVKSRCRLRHLHHRNVLWQIPVTIGHDLFCTHVRFRMEIRHLSQRMHSCIRSAAGCDLHRLPAHFRQKNFHFSLNRIVCGCLFLPSLISGSFILQS